MKKQVLLFLLLFGVTTLAEAQYYGYGGYGGFGGYGNGRFGGYRGGRNAIPQAETPAKKPEPKTAEEIVSDELPRIVEAAELNAFEEAVVKMALTNYVQQRIELDILKLDPDAMREALEKINLEHRSELEAGLPAEKYEAIIKLQENGYDTRKLEKEKRKKKKNS